MRKLWKHVKGFFLDFKDYWFLFKPILQYGAGYYGLSFVLHVIGDVGSNILWVYFYKVVIDMAVAGSSFGSIVAVIALFTSGVLLVDFLRNGPLGKILPEWEVRIRSKIERKIFEKALLCDYRNFDDPDFFHDYTVALKEYMQQGRNAFEYLKDIVSKIITFVTMIVLVTFVSPIIIAINVFVLILTFVFGRLQNKYDDEWWSQQQEVSRQKSYVGRIVYLREFAADLRSNLSPKYMMHRYDDSVREEIRLAKKYKWPRFLFELLGWVTGLGVQFAAMCFAAYGIANGLSEVGSFTASIEASQRLYYCFEPIIAIPNRINRFALYSRRIQRFFNAKSEIETSTGTGVKSLLAADSFPVGLELRDVSFSYDNSAFALSHISMKIAPGQKIAIVGQNGAGKSTLMKLLLRLYDVSSGEILYNDVPIRDYDVHDLRSGVGIAFQDTNLFAMSLRDNLKLYRDADDGILTEAIEKLGLTEVLDKFEEGLDAPLTKEFDENGIVLSGGETQKLGLARLFTGQFGLLLLDEPSAALDPVAEYELNKVIMGLKNTTTILISHRLSTVRDADCIYLVDNGEIIESGTHDELMRKNGKYAAMWNMQAEKYLNGGHDHEEGK